MVARAKSNKTGLQPLSKLVEQFLVFFPQFKKGNLKGNFLNKWTGRRTSNDIIAEDGR